MKFIGRLMLLMLLSCPGCCPKGQASNESSVLQRAADPKLDFEYRFAALSRLNSAEKWHLRMLLTDRIERANYLDDIGVTADVRILAYVGDQVTAQTLYWICKVPTQPIPGRLGVVMEEAVAKLRHEPTKYPWHELQ